MNTLPDEEGGSSFGGGPCKYGGISNTLTDNNRTNNIYGNSNTNFANVSNSYNNRINLGIKKEALRIQTWLSPLEPGRRHQDVSSSRLDGVGNWVLQRKEFESWRKSSDSAVDPTPVCYGSQGVGKTYIRYDNTFLKP